MIVRKGIQKIIHPWDLKPEEAITLQTKLAPGVIRKSRIRSADTTVVAGVDVGYANDMAYAAVVVLNLTDLKVLEKAVASKTVTFPYVPGMLSFREGPVILEALAKLKSPPDLLMVDGQGIAHPRRFGIASHIGLLTDIPAIGCAKKNLLGDYEEPQRTSGSISYLTDEDETIGAVVRTRTAVKPIFVSIGHLIDLNDSIQIILKSCRSYRLPEPIRSADHLSRKQIILSKNQSALSGKRKIHHESTKTRKHEKRK
ncbi:MAG: deoxyribonuclease V [Desulfobacterales bacterium]|jgi:deoxyribonuclease V